MSALSIQVPFPVFQDRDGQPLDNGYVWLGTSSLNPQTNPVVAYYDSALTIVATQPLRTLNGFISRAGSPAQVYVDAVNFSILVQDRQGTTVFSVPEGTGISPNASGVVYDPAGTGAVATTVQAKLRESVSVLDFGVNTTPGTTDMTAAFNAAITAASGTVHIPPGTYRITSSILLKGGIELVGSGALSTQINYSGAGGYAIASSTPGTRIYSVGLSGFTLTDTGTGSVGIYLDSVSTSDFNNVTVVSFDTGVVVYSPVDGYSVYNRFYNVTTNSCTTGFVCNGTGSNATRFTACRFNGTTAVGTTGWSFVNANGCSVTDSDIDICGNGFILTSPAGAGYADSNMFKGNRIEGVTSAFDLGADVRYTHISDNFYQNVTTTYTNAGTRNNFFDPPNNSIEFFAGVNQAAGTRQIVRNSAGGTSPFMVIRDADSSGTAQVTLQIENESSVGVLLNGKSGGVLYYSVTGLGQVAVGSLQLQRAYGFGSPEGARTAPVGSTYQRQDGGAGTSFYVKESGTGNTGWVAK